MSNDVLIMPEYGRNVQRMVEYALTIEDKEERTRCVRSIMHTMENLFPYLKNEESRHKMYDHLALMSGFRLDIDFPYNRPTPEELRYTPERLPYNTTIPLKYRHYGRIVGNMIQEALKEKDEDIRKKMIIRIGSRMRQDFLVWNKDNVDEARLCTDIAALSNGQIDCNFPEFHEAIQKQLQQKQTNNQQKGQNQQNPKKKRKKKK
ncbi:MAG: DUF4290 domain-containing protein [Paludibacteraceae bacterium]|nr:DUF4290 domain-containing protein [Paludibacteraceae bacterium]